jgi:hypothetical protein
MQDFWLQDRIALSLELFGIIMAVLFVKAMVRTTAKRADLVSLLTGSAGIKIFMVARLLLVVSGGATLLVTVFPDLMPLSSEDPNLELGGLLLFVLWPLVATQIGLACVRWEERLARGPVAIWLALLLALVICLPMDKAVIDSVFV